MESDGVEYFTAFPAGYTFDVQKSWIKQEPSQGMCDDCVAKGNIGKTNEPQKQPLPPGWLE